MSLCNLQHGAFIPALRHGLMVATLLLFGASPALTQQRISDTDITSWVQNALHDDPRIPSESVKVATDDGIVHVSGIVRDLAARRYAELEAKYPDDPEVVQ